jgi:uncharacterized protein YjbI with pentapeptide repeats
MSKHVGLSIKKPVSLFNKALHLDFKKFFKSLGKAAVYGFAGDWQKAATSTIDAISAVGLAKNWAENAWLLIYRSLFRAMFNLIEEHEDLVRKKPDDPDMLCHQLDLSFEDLEITLDHTLFDRPKELSIVETIKKPFSQWLQNLGLNEAQAQSISNRFPSYFVLALNDEWRNRPEDYIVIKEKLQTPFINATEKEQGWLRYSAWLQKHVDERMFEETFSLRQIYVPLRAYYEEEIKEDGGKTKGRYFTDEKQRQRIVVDLEQELENWIQKADKDDSIRVISGGPGCGKSSFAKIFAARQSAKGAIPVLFIPLHHFELKVDLVEAVGKFIKYDQFIPHNPLDPDPESGEGRLFIIFDGLDELSMQGKVGMEISQRFCQEVNKQIFRFNQSKTRLQILISGRELVVQGNMSEFRRPQQVLNILPYYIQKEQRKLFIDTNNLLLEDQREAWWKAYGTASGKNYKKIPPVLEIKDVEEITSQPLLNYLVALSFDRGKLDFSKETNMNRIYEDLISAVYERGWAGWQHPVLEGVSEENFFRILEEIGNAAWHGDGRTTTVAEIISNCRHGGLIQLLEKFQEGASKGVTRLLTAFYFRQISDRSGGDRTFEFTHKSFGEYLISRRIVRSLRRMQSELERRKSDPDSGWDDRDALKVWAEICGPTAMDEYIFKFILDEIKLQKIAEVKKWQQVFCSLISYMLHHGMPMERLDPRPSFFVESKMARNSQEALLTVLNACSRLTKIVSKINWPSETSFGSLLSILQGQRSGPNSVIAYSCLSFIDLKDCELHTRDLISANFSNSILDHAGLVMVNFENGNFQNAKIRDAFLRDSNLRYTNFNSADLQDAHLQRASFEESSLQDSNLKNANLEEANLEDTNLEGAILEKTILKGANLKNANLENANLKNANLIEANLENANLKNANLKNANLRKANLENANLKNANLENANLKNANLRKANLIKANLENANLKGTILENSIDDNSV